MPFANFGSLWISVSTSTCNVVGFRHCILWEASAKVQPSNNTAFMGSCPDSDTVKLSFHNLLHNSVQLTVGNGRCLSRTDSGSTVEAVGCAGAAQQMLGSRRFDEPPRPSPKVPGRGRRS